MIKKWNEFIKESIEENKILPGPGEHGSVRIFIDDEEEEWFSSEPALENLISNGKVALFDNEIWYFGDDEETINVLKEYFPLHDLDIDMDDDEDYDENTGRGYDLNGEEQGFDEENESMSKISEASYVKNYDNKSKEWIVLYANETKSKEFKKEEDADDFIKTLKKEDKKGGVESYRDKMKRKVAAAKEKAKKQVNEDVDTVTDEGFTESDESFICPYCKAVQEEHPENILMDSDMWADYNCEECGEEFQCSKQVEIRYVAEKIIKRGNI